MTRSFSLYLDAFRLFAALAVVMAHWAFPRFTGSDHLWMRLHDLGGEAVIVFFVMSGLLISYAADKHAGQGPRAFAADRLSRLWSVALPAVLLMIILDPVGQRIDPDMYKAVGYDGGFSLKAALTSISFTGQLWFTSVQPGSNGPWWSLGYEAWYYAIFALMFFTNGRKRWLFAGAAMLVAGPKIWLLMPSWLMGVWVWRQIKLGEPANYSRAVALALALIPLGIYVLAHQALLHLHLLAWTRTILGEDLVHQLQFSDTFIWSTLLGILTSAHILGMAGLLSTQKKAGSFARKFGPSIRWLAGGSFALYLVHFPIMHFVGAILPGNVDMAWRQVLVLILPIIAAYAFAELSERRRPALRRYLRSRMREPGTSALPA